jgi:hypothetical protein
MQSLNPRSRYKSSGNISPLENPRLIRPYKSNPILYDRQKIYCCVLRGERIHLKHAIVACLEVH